MTYAPRGPGRLPDRRSVARWMLTYFERNPDETLLWQDVAIKWPGNSKGRHPGELTLDRITQHTRPAVRAGWLERATSGGDTYFRPGPRFADAKAKLAALRTTEWGRETPARQLESRLCQAPT